MRYKVIKAIAPFVIAVALITTSFSIVGCAQQDNISAKQNLELNRVEADEAKEIALTHANVDKNELEFINVTADNNSNDNAKDHDYDTYEVVFKVGNIYYEYEINANTGEIDKYSKNEKNLDSSNTSSVLPKTSSNSTTSLEQAKLIAYKDANISHNDVKYVEITSDNQDGEECYEIDFSTSSKKYEYKISKTTGLVLGKSQENRVNSSYASSDKSSGTSSIISKPDNALSGTNGNLNIEQAKDVAVKYVSDSIEKNITSDDITKVELDTDDGISIYEIDIYFDNALYSIEIDSKTGSVASFKQSHRTGTDTSSQSVSNTISKRIDIEQVKSKVLAHANIKSSDVTFTKSELEIKNGIDTYDFEFHTNTHEYEYDVNAFTGEIISFEHDKK